MKASVFQAELRIRHGSPESLGKKIMPTRALDYDEEAGIVTRKFAVLRRAARGQQELLDWITRKEEIAVQCLLKRLPKKAIKSIHSEIRVWIRDDLFQASSKEKLLSDLAAIDAERK